jgi:ABC-type enterochelin transport system permease subunit
MPLPQRTRIEPVVLILIAVACFVAAWFSYSGQSVTNSNLRSPSTHGWGHLFLFILVGVIVRLCYVGAGRSRHEKNAKRDASSKT